jgi:tetratricopeptide (TPR) repeat protein
LLRKTKLILIITIFFVVSLTINVGAESNYNWDNLIKTVNYQLQENKDDILLNYSLAVAYANTGEIKKAYDIIDNFGSSVSRHEFNAAVFSYLADWYNYQQSDNLFYLNCAAFQAVINKKYAEAVNIFEYALKLDQNNYWLINNLAAALLELDRYDLALDYANQALVMAENEYSHLIKGVAYYKKGDYIRALVEAASARKLFKALADEEYQDFTQ